MHLWTEYEGRTIAGAYPLRKLLRSEGRNGFFATSNSTGDSAVIRLTEAHFDEEEVMKRWRQVAELHQDNLIGIEGVGKTTLDGVALTYALMERNDANLDDVLKERPLTAAETLEVAKSVAAALSALHASGLVHEHIEPVNVLAVGDLVKLRSDCVRECVADGEFTSAEACEDLRRRDIHDYGTLLLRCLTLEREWTPTQRLAEPLNRVIPGALDGSWTLEKIASVLNPDLPKPLAAAPAAAQGTLPGLGSPEGASAVRPLVPSGVLRPASANGAAVDAAGVARERAEPTMRTRARAEVAAVEPAGTAFNKLWLLGVAAAILVLWLGWHLLRSKPAVETAATPPSAPVAQTAPAPRVVPPASRAQPVAPATAVPETAAPAVPAATRTGNGWYVIAFTYNHENQARAKAVRLSTNHLSFRPEVFSPRGHAPYFVSLGGPMSEQEAQAVQRRARREGLPRDTFVRHY